MCPAFTYSHKIYTSKDILDILDTDLHFWHLKTTSGTTPVQAIQMLLRDNVLSSTHLAPETIILIVLALLLNFICYH